MVLQEILDLQDLLVHQDNLESLDLQENLLVFPKKQQISELNLIFFRVLMAQLACKEVQVYQERKEIKVLQVLQDLKELLVLKVFQGLQE